MSKSIYCINFYGHNDSSVAGQPAGAAPLGAFWRSAARGVKRERTLKVVGASRIGCPNVPGKRVAVLDYNAGLGEGANKVLAGKIMGSLNLACSENDEQIFLVTGYSSGGISAIHMALALNRAKQNVFYVGLSDAAFQRNESDYLLKSSGVVAKYRKNYYQTKENDPTNPEIHDEVAGFTNFNLDKDLPTGQNEHESAVIIGNQKMIDDVLWCIQNC